MRWEAKIEIKELLPLKVYPIHLKYILYFLDYKIKDFSFQNNPKNGPKNLDPVYKMDLSFGIVLERRTTSYTEFHETEIDICEQFKQGKKVLYSNKYSS